MKKCIFFLLSVSILFSLCRCTEDDDKVIFDGDLIVESDFEDGSVVTDSEVTFKVRYSGNISGDVGDREPNYTYKFYVGVDPDDLKEYKTNTPRLEPYKRYYWYAVYEAFGVVGKKTEMRTFYYVPSVVATTENGDGEWSTTLKWNEIGENMLPTTIKVTPNIEGYPFENNIEIKPGQNSYKFKLGDAGSPTNAAYTHWWDDANAVYYEPIVYTYNFTISVKVDDRTFDFAQEVKDIIINKQDVVKDHEFNVYRLAKIGNKIWTIDDYRAKTYYDPFVGKYVEPDYGLYVNEKTCAAYYNTDVFNFSKVSSDNTNNSIPQGFHISTEQDWLDLEAYYGVVSDLKYGNENDYWVCYTLDFEDRPSRNGWFNSYLYTGNDQHIKAKLSSQYGWETDVLNDSVVQSIGIGAIFNAKPTRYGAYYEHGYKTCSVGYYVPNGWNRLLTSESNGIAREFLDPQMLNNLSIRLVKD